MEAQSSSSRRSPEKHREILEAASRLVARHGYASTTIEGIATEAGVGKQTIYRWWDTKAALFVEVYAVLVDREKLRTSGDNAAERLSSMLRQLFALYRETPAGRILTGLVGEAASDETTRSALTAGLVLDRRNIVTELVADLDDADRVNEIIVAMIWKRLILEPETLDDAFAGELTRLVLGREKHGGWNATSD